MTHENDNNQIRFYVPNTVQDSYDKNLVKIRNKISGQEIEINVRYQNYSGFSFFGIFNIFGIFGYIWSTLKEFFTDIFALLFAVGVVVYIVMNYFSHNVK